MNIFEYLNLPAGHRGSGKIVQLVKHWHEVNPKADQGILHKKVEFPLYAQIKRDGVHAIVLALGGHINIFSRTGKKFCNVEHLENALANTLPTGVYFAELCNANCSLEELSGVVNPNRMKALTTEQVSLCSSMVLHFFDLVTVTEFIKGSSARKFSDRFDELYARLSLSDLLSLSEGPVDICHSFFVKNKNEAERFAENAIHNGEEGIVLKQDVGWLAGAKDWHQMKIVRSIDYDLECVGYEEGTGKYAGLVANLLFRWRDGQTIRAMLGKGWTHENAKEMFDVINYAKYVDMPNAIHRDSPIRKIFRVYALQESSKGVLRLAKVGEVRHDKVEADY